MRQELLRCAKDPVYFMKTYVKIVHPTKGKLPFNTYPFQDDCVNAFLEHRFNIILKSRQLGLSTVTAAFSVWFALFNRDKNVLVIATKLDVAMNFIKKVKTVLDNLPPWFSSIFKLSGETKKSIALSNGSTITAVPTSEDAGRSEALSLLIVDEAAIIRDFEEVWTAVFPTLSTGGRAILLSTPKGAAGQFYELWQQAINASGESNDFNPITLPWNVHPEHDEAWFKKETKSLTARKIAQEYLCDFNASGETFLQNEDMEELRKMVRDPIEKKGPDRGLWVWERPVPGEKYFISADVSRGNAEDSSTFHVLKNSTNEVVAEYCGKMPPDEFGAYLNEIAKEYNTALVCPENNTFGYSAIRTLHVLGYKNLYYEGKRPGYIPSDPREVAGFSTQKNSREKILANLEKLIRNKAVKIYSARTYLEFKTFVWRGPRACAQDGKHDDLIMSLAIGAWLLDPDTGSSNGDYSQAFLQAMSVSTRQIDGMANVRPVMPAGMIMGSAPRQEYRPTTLSDHIRRLPQEPPVDPNDLSWLLK